MTSLTARRISLVTQVTPQQACMAARRIWGPDPSNRTTAKPCKNEAETSTLLCLYESWASNKYPRYDCCSVISDVPISFCLAPEGMISDGVPHPPHSFAPHPKAQAQEASGCGCALVASLRVQPPRHPRPRDRFHVHRITSCLVQKVSNASGRSLCPSLPFTPHLRGTGGPGMRRAARHMISQDVSCASVISSCLAPETQKAPGRSPGCLFP